MIDTHVHLNANQFVEDVKDVIDRAREAGVNTMICVGFDDTTNTKAIELATTYPYIYATVGIHPTDALHATPDDMNKISELANHPRVVAIGECGLDYYWDKVGHDVQKAVLKAQIALAITCNKPLVLHMRDASEDLYEVLLPYKGKIQGVMHCYSGSAQMAMKYVDLGLYISLGGPITFLNAKAPKEVARVVPLHRLLIETDAPYLAPHPLRGKRNEPSYIPYIVDALANEKGITREEVIKATTQNAISLFKLEETL